MGKKKNKTNRNDIQGKNSGSKFLKIFTVVLAAAIVIAGTVFYVIYYRFAHHARKLAGQTAQIYAFGNGDDMKELIPPGYIKSFEDKSKVLGINDIQDIYIDKFQNYVEGKIGDIDKIECDIKEIQAVSNVEDIKQTFEENGVVGVSQYRSIDADWIVTGKDGRKITVRIQEFVLKCDDGWYVDYVQFPEEISGSSQP